MKRFMPFLLSIGLVLVLFCMTIPSATSVLAAVSVDGWGTLSSGTTATLNGVWGTSSSDVYACGDSGKILHYDGTSWSGMTSGVANALSGIWGSSANNVFAVGQNGTIVSYNGTDWSTMSSGTSSHLNAVWGNAADSVFAVGNTGTMVGYNGTAWTPLAAPLGLGNHFRGIWGTSTTDMFVVGDGGVIIHYDGMAWEILYSGNPPRFSAAWGPSADDVFVVGNGGTIARYDGENLTFMTSGISDDLNAVWGTSSNDVFAVGTHGSILHYDGNPEGIWTPMQSGTSDDLRGLWGIDPLNVYTVGRGGIILHYKEAEPVIVSVTPNLGNQGETLNVTIAGSNFLQTDNVSFGEGIVATWAVVNDVQISANITIATNAAVGPRDLAITNLDGTGWLYGGFSIPAAQATGANPGSGDQGATLTVFISGTNLGSTEAVSLGPDITVNEQPAVSPTQVSVNITIGLTAAPGLRDAYLVTPEGEDVVFGFTVNELPPPPAPTVTGISPNSGVQGQTLNVVITGTNLTGATADFGAGITINGVVVNSATQITASITIDAAAAVGPRNVTVTTDGGEVTVGGFAVNVPAPTLTGVSPTSGFQGDTLQVTLTGTNLAGASAVSFGQGITVGDITIDGPNQITVEITIQEAASTGERTATVTTPGGSASLSDDFTVAVPPPALEGIDVAVGRQKQTMDVVLTGADLDGATAVSFGDGITVDSIVAVSATEIRVSITIDKDAEPGLRDVSVTTPGGTTSLPEAFQVQEAGGSISPLWWVGLALLLLLLGLLFLVLMRRRKTGKQATA